MSFVLNEFPIFNELPLNIKLKINCFYISTDVESELYNSERCFALFKTDTDQVYGVGANWYGQLGFGHNIDVKNYAIIEELCGKNVYEFFGGKHCMFAINNKGEVFGWGLNQYGQLAKGYTNRKSDFHKPAKVDFFDDKNIINISSGFNHCLGLSSNGLLYAWGDNNYGQLGCGGYSKRIQIPIALNEDYGIKENIKFIHCYRNRSFAVTVNGLVYSWGENNYGQLAHKVENYLFSQIIYLPRLIDIKNIVKICSKGRNTFFLDSDGYVHRCGTSVGFQPIKISISHKIVDIFCCETTNCDVLLNTEDCVIEFKEKIILRSRFDKTNYINIFDFLSKSTKFTLQTIHLTNTGVYKIFSYKIDFNNNEISYDFKFENIFLNGFYQKYFSISDEILGAGNFGTVYKVKSKIDDLDYAIKISNNYQIKEIPSEVKIISDLNHDFVVSLISAWIERKTLDRKSLYYCYIQMELCPHSLKDILKQEVWFEVFIRQSSDPMSSLEYFLCCEIIRELTECLNYLHSLNPPIMHRDLKPANVLIGRPQNNRFLKLCDFGLAKFHEMSYNTRMVGTDTFMAPEVKDGHIYNTKADIYSLAVIATHLFGFNTKNDFFKSIVKYSKTKLDMKFKIIFKTLRSCIESTEYQKRPNCEQFLSQMQEWNIDKNIILSEEHSIQTKHFLQTFKNDFYINFFNSKFNSNEDSNKISFE